MALRDNLHSNVVAWLRVVLPLSALALLSTLFLVARTSDPDAQLPFSETELQEMAREQRVERPSFSGITEEGHAIRVSALTATPRRENQNIVDTTMVQGWLETGEDSLITVTSDAGTILAEESRVVLQGNVRIETSTGYTVLTDELHSALDVLDMETKGPVTAEGPLGNIEADRMTVVPTGEETDDVSVVFKGRVKLLYLPQNQ